MKIRRIWIRNYKSFRSTFEDDALARTVLDNLECNIKKQLLDEKEPHIDLCLSAAYDDEGDALFDVQEMKILQDNSVIINVDFTGTVK